MKVLRSDVVLRKSWHEAEIDFVFAQVPARLY